MATLHSAWRNLFSKYFLAGQDIKSAAYIVLDGVDEAINYEMDELLKFLASLEQGQSMVSMSSDRVNAGYIKHNNEVEGI